MKTKRNLLILLLATLLFSFMTTGCGSETNVSVNVENKENLHNTTLGTDSLIKIGNGLYYDSTTRIVYWWNGMLKEDGASSTRYDTTPSPYYAPNGLPYKYNPETNTFEEIKNEVNIND